MLAFLRAPALAYLVLGVEGVAFVVGEVLSVTMLQRILDPDLLGRVMGIMDSVMVVAILAGSLLAPVLVHLTSLPTAMIVAGALLVTLGALVLPRARELDRRSAATAAELAPRVDVLRQLGIFEAATTQALEALAAASQEVDVEGGTPVIREGDEPDDLYVVLSGSLNVFSVGEGTRERAIRVLSPGDYFGEIGLLERIPRTATVTAAGACRLLQISGEDFLRIVNEGPPVAGVLRTGVAARLARTHPSSELGHA